MKKTIVVLSLALAAAGCATADKSVFQGGTSLTATVQNPVTRNDWALIETTYGAALRIALTYRRLPICATGTSESFSNLCARKDVLLKIQAANAQVRKYLIPFRSFMRNNQTLSALSAIGALRTAISDFQSVLSSNGVK